MWEIVCLIADIGIRLSEYSLNFEVEMKFLNLKCELEFGLSMMRKGKFDSAFTCPFSCVLSIIKNTNQQHLSNSSTKFVVSVFQVWILVFYIS